MAKRNFVLLNQSGNKIGDYTGAEPSKAAKKAARRGEKTIFLRETGKKTIRAYKGSVKTETLKSDTPFKKKGEKVKIGVATYVGTATLQNGKLVVKKRKS